jgi:hypothetical protein
LLDIAKEFTVYVSKTGSPYFDHQAMDMFAYKSALVTNLFPKKYDAHFYIAVNRANDCTQLYNTGLSTKALGRTCAHFDKSFGDCGECHRFRALVNQAQGWHVIHYRWFNGKQEASLVHTFTLQNGKSAYLGVGISEKGS